MEKQIEEKESASGTIEEEMQNKIKTQEEAIKQSVTLYEAQTVMKEKEQ